MDREHTGWNVNLNEIVAHTADEKDFTCQSAVITYIMNAMFRMQFFKGFWWNFLWIYQWKEKFQKLSDDTPWL